MSDIYECNNCNFEIYVGEFSQDYISLLPIDKISSFKKITEEELSVFDENFSYLTSNSTKFFIRCSSCKVLNFIGKKYADFICVLMPETKIIIPQLIPMGEDGYPESISTAVSVSESYFSNTLLEKENKISCLCGNNNIRENSYFDYDYLAFPWLLMISLGELSEQEKYKNIPIEDRMRYVYLTTYQVHECPTCQRFIIIGKNEQNQQFKAIYKRK